mgnify:CR=1 FL=1
MSALAELCARRGAIVTGCDQRAEGVHDLERLGTQVVSGHDAAHLGTPRALVVSSAIPKTHPEVEAARASVRAFLDAERAAGHFVPHRTSWTTFDAAFSRRAGAAGSTSSHRRATVAACRSKSKTPLSIAASQTAPHAAQT